MSKRYLMKAVYEIGKFFKDTFVYFLNHPGRINLEVSFKEIRAKNENMLFVDLNY